MVADLQIVGKTKLYFDSFRKLVEDWEVDRNTDAYDKLIGSVTSIDELFKSLNLLVISGSYVLYEEKVNDLMAHIDFVNNELHSIVSDKSEIYNLPLTDQGDIAFDPMDSYVFDVLRSVITALSHIVIYFRNFQSRILKLIEGKCDVSLFENNDSSSPFIIDIDFIEINKWLELFRFNCQIALIDHSLFVEGETLNRLLVIHSKLKATHKDDSLISSVLVDKSEFLILKIREKLNKDNRKFTYTLDFRDNEIQSIGEELVFFDTFKKRFFEHYSKESNFNRKIDKIYSKSGNDYTFQDYHDLIKHYKEDQNDLSRVDALIEDFESKFKENVYFTDCRLTRRAWQVNFNFLVNNRLSILLELANDFNDDIEKCLNKIDSLQRQTNVYNYFPYYKVVMFLREKIDNALVSGAINFSKVEDYNNKYEKYLKVLYKNFEWCFDNRFGIFQVEVSECIKPIIFKNDSIYVFLSSSYISPINYNEVKNEIDNLKLYFDNHASILPLYKHIVQEKDEIRDIRNELNSHDKRQIEILGIFSAIVMFSAGEIQILSTLKDEKNIIISSLVFAYALCSFVFLIHLVTRDNQTKISRYQMFFGVMYLISTCLCLSFLLDVFPF